jgi:hypothetical protein
LVSVAPTAAQTEYENYYFNLCLFGIVKFQNTSYIAEGWSSEISIRLQTELVLQQFIQIAWRNTRLGNFLNGDYQTNIFYTITLITVFVPTYSVWWVILFRETGVVH